MEENIESKIPSQQRRNNSANDENEHTERTLKIVNLKQGCWVVDQRGRRFAAEFLFLTLRDAHSTINHHKRPHQQTSPPTNDPHFIKMPLADLLNISSSHGGLAPISRPVDRIYTASTCGDHSKYRATLAIACAIYCTIWDAREHDLGIPTHSHTKPWCWWHSMTRW